MIWQDLQSLKSRIITKPMCRWDITGIKPSMSHLLSTFFFEDYDDREKAAGLIYDNCGGRDAYVTGSCGDRYYIDIYSDCTNVPLAVQYCQANCGHRE